MEGAERISWLKILVCLFDTARINVLVTFAVVVTQYLTKVTWGQVARFWSLRVQSTAGKAQQQELV